MTSNQCQIIETLLLIRLHSCFASYDSTIHSASMLFEDSAMAIGFDKNNDTILLIGGESYPRQFITLKENTFTLINQNYLSTSQQTYGFGQHFTTLEDELWIIREDGEGFITFNLNTYTVNTPSITLQTNVGTRGCLTSMTNYIIIVGGGIASNVDPINTVQIYDINEEGWLQDVPSMIQKRRSFACLGVNNIVYAIGGMYDAGDTFLNTIEALDVSNMDSIQSTSWHMLQGTLSEAVAGCQAVQYNTDIVVIGGEIDNKPYSLIDVNLIDTVTGSCQVVGQLAEPVAFAPSIVVGNTLHIFGGWKWKAYEYSTVYQYITLPTLVPSKYPTTEPTSSPIKYPTTNPTQTIQSTTTARTTHTIPITTQTATLQVTDISTSSAISHSPLETTQTSSTTIQIFHVENSTADTVTMDSLSTSPYYLISNTKSTATTSDDEHISENERTPNLEDDIVLILAICVVAICSTALVLYLYQNSRQLKEPMQGLEKHHPETQQSQVNIEAYTTQVTNAVLNRTQTTLSDGSGIGKKYTDDLAYGNDRTTDGGVINVIYRPDTVSIDSVRNTRTIEGNAEGEQSVCVDCGTMKAGKMYDGLVYCDTCFSLYYADTIYETKGNINNVNNIEMIATGADTTKGYFD